MRLTVGDDGMKLWDGEGWDRRIKVRGADDSYRHLGCAISGWRFDQGMLRVQIGQTELGFLLLHCAYRYLLISRQARLDLQCSEQKQLIHSSSPTSTTLDYSTLLYHLLLQLTGSDHRCHSLPSRPSGQPPTRALCHRLSNVSAITTYLGRPSTHRSRARCWYLRYLSQP